MKTVYIPKGETVYYETLETDHLVVKGCLEVHYDLHARTISGNGVISASTVFADDIRINDLKASAVICHRLIAKRVQAPELYATESVAVSCFLSSAYVETDRLTVALSEVDEVKAQEVIHLKPKKRSLFRLLLASALRSLWTHLTVPAARGKPVDAVPAAEPQDAPAGESEETKDDELARLVAVFKLLRDSGYTLKILPGTPEGNAPRFGAGCHGKAA